MARSERYTSTSRFTDPGARVSMLKALPYDVKGICRAAKRQTIHHNLLPYYGVPSSEWKGMARVWPPRMADILETLRAVAPHNLQDPRSPRHRVIGACMLESHLLAGMLRYRGIPVRIRAGYFKAIRANRDHIVTFWENLSREKGVMADLLRTDPEAWRENIVAYNRRQNDIDHHIEHWICEYWDTSLNKWRLLDANTAFLRAHSAIKIGFHLPRKYFEYAFEAWQRMRRTANFNPDEYFEDPQDGRSHIRSQLLWDFFSLLNHDIAGYDEPTPKTMDFLKKQAYATTSDEELRELDTLAAMLSRDPSVEELIAFYHGSVALRIVRAEKDPYVFVAP